jgi:uncharacterized protein (TIGR03067 family)
MSHEQHARTSTRPTQNIVEDLGPLDEYNEDVLTAWYAEVSDVPGPFEHRLACDLDQLQGAWMTIPGQRQTEMLIAGHQLAVYLGNGDIYMGTFTLGTSGPLTMLDVRVQEGPNRHRGLPVLCICKLKGDTLRWCSAFPGDSVRPTAFDNHNPHLLCLVFRREHRA